MLLSYRTLEVGSAQVDTNPLLVTSEQFPVVDDPFTDTVLLVGNRQLDGTTGQGEKKLYQRLLSC